MQGGPRWNSPLTGGAGSAQWLEPGALKSGSQVQSPSGSVGFSLFHSHRLKAWAPHSGRMSNKMCALGHCTKQPSRSLANPSSTVGGPLGEASCQGGGGGEWVLETDLGGKPSLATYCVTLGELFNLSEPLLWTGTYHIGLWWFIQAVHGPQEVNAVPGTGSSTQSKFAVIVITVPHGKAVL